MLKNLSFKELTQLSWSDAFERGKFKLWFQPVYQTKTGAVLHNEVLLRWQDDQGELHLPQEFLRSVSSPQSLQQLDQIIIRKSADFLAEHPDRCLSVNLSGEGLNDYTLSEYIQTVLDQSGVNPKHLSFELTEVVIAKNFTAALTFIREVKNIGCSIIIDDFSSCQLTLFQCQQLNVDFVKVDGQLIQRLKTDPSSRVLTQAILEGAQTLSQVIAKYVSDPVTLALVEEVNLKYVQGHYFKAPSPEPNWDVHQFKTAEPITPPTSETKPPSLSWRVIRGAGFVGLGLAAVAVGAASISYRMMHITVKDAMLNGRIVRIQAIADGKLDAFYARPGVEVKSGQVLARIGIEPQPPDAQALLKQQRTEADAQIRTQLETSHLQGQFQVKATQLTAAREALVALNQQLRNLDRQKQAVRQVNVRLASDAVSQEQAAVEAAVAKEKAARSEYERYQGLVEEGAVSKLQMEKARGAWESAEAEVNQAQAALRSTQTSLNAAQSGVAIDDQGDLLDQQTKLLQTIQKQEGLVKTLEAQVASGSQQLNQIQALYKNRPSLVSERKNTDNYAQVKEVLAPFAGVIYRTEREQGEQVAKSDPMLTLLNCNELWVEAVVSADVANRIDAQKPVKVHLANSSQTLIGEIDLIQPLDRTQDLAQQTKLTQVQALLPTIPPKLEGQLLARVTVKIPPTPQYTQSRQFCGLGQATKLSFRKKSWINR